MDVEHNAAALDAVKDDKDKTPPSLAEERSIEHGENDLLHAEVDAVLTAKMALINDVSD